MKSSLERIDTFRDRGARSSPQRASRFGQLHGNERQATRDACCEMPGISLRAVDTTLADLVDVGEIEVLSAGSGVTHTASST